MIVCNKCRGKVFVDLTYTDNKNYELFCLHCGKRDFVGIGHPLFETINAFVKKSLVA